VLHVLCISFSLTPSFLLYLENIASHGAPNYAVSPSSCHLIYLRSKHRLKTVFKYLQPKFFPQYERPSFTPTHKQTNTNTGKITIFDILIFKFLESRREEETLDSIATSIT
jgi:hypothetical protein